MSSEIWKPIKDYEGLYEVSSLGRIKSMPKKFIRNGAVTHFEEKILTPSDSHGYRSVVLTKNGIHKTHSVHRLVALAFIQNPNNYTQINHKDENKSNNRVENLEWCTPHENTEHYHKTLRNGKPMYNQKACLQIIDGEVIAEYKSLNEASRRTGVSVSNIYCCCIGKTTTAGGYQWKYKI